MGKAVVVGDRYTVCLFRLLGFAGHVVDKSSKAIEVVKELAKDETISMILVTSDVVAQAKEEFERLRVRIAKPLIVEIPTIREVKYEKVDYFGILRRALGI